MRLIFFTGAGASQESGIDTFRDKGGLWDKFDIDKVCNFNPCIENYDDVHHFYDLRRDQLQNVHPNSTHFKIAELSQKYDVINFTTNVDDLFERAGSNPIYLHGNIRKIKCPNCSVSLDIGFKSHKDIQFPHKKGCTSNLLKPDVVFFFEEAPEYDGFFKVINNLKADDIVIVIGASMQVVPLNQYISDKDIMKFNINPNLTLNKGDDHWYDIPKSSTEGLEYMILKHGKIITKFFYFIILIEGILDNFYLKYDKILNS